MVISTAVLIRFHCRPGLLTNGVWAVNAQLLLNPSLTRVAELPQSCLNSLRKWSSCDHCECVKLFSSEAAPATRRERTMQKLSATRQRPVSAPFSGPSPHHSVLGGLGFDLIDQAA